MLEIGKANEVSFKVAVNGTSATPSVRLVIETPDAELGFTANMGDGHWFTQVFIPECVKAGDYTMRVEVLVNGRLFVPVKKIVTVASSAEIPATVEVEEVIFSPIKPVKEAVVEAPPSKPSVKQPIETPSKQPPLIKELVKAAPLKLPKISSSKKLSSGMPKGTGKKAVPVRISIAEIAADSDKRFGGALAESKTYKKPIKAVTPTVNIKSNTPVTLKKGEVVYE